MIDADLNSYAAYKSHGIDSLGEIPETWEVKRIKDFALVVRGGSPRPAGDLNLYDGNIPFLKVGDLTASETVYLSTHTHSIKEAGLSSTRLVPQNTLLLTNSGATLGIPKVCTFETTFNDGIAAFTRLRNINQIFLFYFLKSRTEWYLNQASFGQGQPNLNIEIIANTFLPVPSLEEQQAIAGYLDTKTAQIDRKIDLLEQKEEKYANLKKSLINETVKRGLDKSTPMKDSGVEWIGQIPAHWEVKRISDIAVQQKHKNVGLLEKNLLSLSYGKLKRKDIETSFGLLPESFETYQIVNPGNVILRLTDLQNDWTSLRVGLARERGIITSAYLCLRFSKHIHPVFSYYVLHVYDLSKVFYWLGSGLRSSMKFEDIKVLPFILPSLEEQKAIAEYLEIKTAHIEKIIETIKLEVEKLKELRKTLINDVVTGKIKVYEA